MSDQEKKSELTLRIKRVRSRLASSVKTGGAVNGDCHSKTDPTVDGQACPTQQFPCPLGTRAC